MVVPEDGDGDGETRLGGRIIWWWHLWEERKMFNVFYIWTTECCRNPSKSLWCNGTFFQMVLPVVFGFAFWHCHAPLDSYLLKVYLILLRSSVNLTQIFKMSPESPSYSPFLGPLACWMLYHFLPTLLVSSSLAFLTLFILCSTYTYNIKMSI